MNQYTTAMGRYLIISHLLRSKRKRRDWRPEQDRHLLSILDDEYQLLSEAEQKEVEAHTSLWPEAEHTLIDDAEIWIDTDLDAAHDGPVATPPRTKL